VEIVGKRAITEELVHDVKEQARFQKFQNFMHNFSQSIFLDEKQNKKHKTATLTCNRQISFLLCFPTFTTMAAINRKIKK
jgi:hypothetical protein